MPPQIPVHQKASQLGALVAANDVHRHGKPLLVLHGLEQAEVSLLQAAVAGKLAPFSGGKQQPVVQACGPRPAPPAERQSLLPVREILSSVAEVLFTGKGSRTNQ
jgi:hypothetical protein